MKKNRFKIHALILIVSSVAGMALSFIAQQGGIHPVTATLSPIFGPWSYFFPPNEMTFAIWSIEHATVTILSTVLLILSLLLFKITNKFLLKVNYTLSIFMVLFWVLCGLSRVILDLT